MKNLISLSAMLMLLLAFGGQIDAQDDDLAETYTSDLGDIIINYPEGWQAVNESGVIILINGDPDTINQEVLPPGLAALVLLPPEFLALFEVEADATPTEAIEVLTQLMDQDFGEVGEPELVTLENDNRNEMTFASVSDDVGDGLIAAVGYKAGTMGVLAFTAPGELADFEPIFYDMLNTLMYQGPEVVEVPQSNAISWSSGNVTLSASNFYIVAAGQAFTAAGDDVLVSGDEEPTTLDVSWQEHGVEMRVTMYFEADSEFWNVYEIRTYDGSEDGEWVRYEENLFISPLGEAFTLDSLTRERVGFEIHFTDLEVQAFIAE